MNKREALLQAMELMYAMAQENLTAGYVCVDLYDALDLDPDRQDDFAVLVTNALLGENQ